MTRSRFAAVAGASALSAAATLWLSIATHPQVTDAARTPGLLELATSIAASVWPSTPLGTILGIWHDVAAMAAAVLCGLAVWRFTRSLVAASAIGLVAAASPWMTPTLAPPDVTALVAASATACALLGGSTLGAAAGFALAGAIAPQLILPNAVLCWWIGRREANRPQERRALIVAALSAVVAGTVAMAVPALPGQARTPVASAILGPIFNLTSGAGASAGLIADVCLVAGPLLLALAALGAFAFVFNAPEQVDDRRRRWALVLGLPAAGCVAGMYSGADPVRVMAPFVVSLWIVAGLGIAEIILRLGVARRAVGGVVIAAILVAIHIAPRINPPPAAAAEARSLGYESLTRHQFQTLLYQLPPNSAVVSDDAVTSVLLRSLSANLERSRNGIRVVSNTVKDIAIERNQGRVFAFPRMQLNLQDQGVRFVDDAPAPSPGIAEVLAVAPCGPLATSWQAVSQATGVTTLAMVAGNDGARGPIVVYAGSAAPIDATPSDWPALALRGFYTRSYDRAQPERRQGLLDEVINDAAHADDPAVNSAHVARIELWRVPGAPRTLRFTLSAPAAFVAGTQLARGTGPIEVCPVFPFTVRPFRK